MLHSEKKRKIHVTLQEFNVSPQVAYRPNKHFISLITLQAFFNVIVNDDIKCM